LREYYGLGLGLGFGLPFLKTYMT